MVLKPVPFHQLNPTYDATRSSGSLSLEEIEQRLFWYHEIPKNERKKAPLGRYRVKLDTDVEINCKVAFVPESVLGATYCLRDRHTKAAMVTLNINNATGDNWDEHRATIIVHEGYEWDAATLMRLTEENIYASLRHDVLYQLSLTFPNVLPLADNRLLWDTYLRYDLIDAGYCRPKANVYFYGVRYGYPVVNPIVNFVKGL
jgi:hypothetical protein